MIEVGAPTRTGNVVRNSEVISEGVHDDNQRLVEALWVPAALLDVLRGCI